jgi:hypothetical protein
MIPPQSAPAKTLHRRRDAQPEKRRTSCGVSLTIGGATNASFTHSHLFFPAILHSMG